MTDSMFKVWMGVGTASFIVAFILWVRTLYLFRVQKPSIPTVFPLFFVFLAAAEMVSCGWLSFVAVDVRVAMMDAGNWLSPVYGLASMVMGGWAFAKLSPCVGGACYRTKARSFYHELFSNQADVVLH